MPPAYSPGRVSRAGRQSSRFGTPPGPDRAGPRNAAGAASSCMRTGQLRLRNVRGGSVKMSCSIRASASSRFSREPSARCGAKERPCYGSIPLAGNAAFLDNAPTMSTTTKPRSFRGRLEFRIISIGMSAFAYLLEKMILRSVKSGGAKPRGSRIS